MTRSTRKPGLPNLLICLTVTAAACHGEARREVSSPAPAATFSWPVPDGWKHETIPFPLDFAPSLAFRGSEELRFPPGMWKPDAPDYWSYAFVWWLEGRPALDARTLEDALARYFAGLSDAVGGKKYRFDPAHFRASLAPAQAHDGRAVLRGEVNSYDAFVTGAPITLHAEIQIWDCAHAGRRVLLAALSPQPFGGAAWQELAARQQSFHCE
jgi:hypothetical protein